MGKETINDSGESRPDWEHMEDWHPGQFHGMIQELPEQGVTEHLVRARSTRRSEPAGQTHSNFGRVRRSREGGNLEPGE